MATCAASGVAQSWLPASVYPSWAGGSPSRTITIDIDLTKTNIENGARLKAAIDALVPGDALLIGPGRWLFSSKIDVTVQGTAAKPIWIGSKYPLVRPLITHVDAKKNVFNIGEASPARYLVLRNLEITGGSNLISLADCDHVWIHACSLHDGAGAGISTQRDCSHIHITDNVVTNSGPSTSRAVMYFGSSTAAHAISWSIIAYNQVFTASSVSMGAGIELEQGCHHNWMIGNIAFETNDACIRVDGTNGNGINVIERNTCWNSRAVIMQVQGEAVVRNNVCMNGVVAFSSGDQAASATNIQVTNNTFINSGDAVRLGQWSGKPNMVFANNACYSERGNALRFSETTTGVVVVANVVYGNTVNIPVGAELMPGNGLQDFQNVRWDGILRNVLPTVAGPLDGRGEVLYSTPRDAVGYQRKLPLDIGALESQASLISDVTEIPAMTGGEQRLTIHAGPSHGGRIYLVVGTMTGLLPGFDLGGYTVPLVPDAWFAFTLTNANREYLGETLGFLDQSGRADLTLFMPPMSTSMIGTVFAHVALIMDGVNVRYVTNAALLGVK
ncbi:MAG: right-handed parallel beta-helix repeat-containing protein [Planctomycetes bacterium]|nr:right-handed parallel beta-helix repeat-containing protein [Planctomycetota bacterium]